MKQLTTNRPPRQSALTMRVLAACRDPRHHCAVVLAANAGLVACAAVEPFTPALLLHLVLLPVNAWRLLQAMRSGASVRSAADGVAATRGPLPSLSVPRSSGAPWRPGFQALATAQTVRLPPRRAEP